MLPGSKPTTPAQIDYLLSLVRQTRGESYVTKAENWARAANRTTVSAQINRLKAELDAKPEATLPTPERVGKGFYMLDGYIYKVIDGRTGRPYAKMLDGETGAWIFAPGVAPHLRPEHALTLEQAEQYGRLTGVCCRCGARLTDQESIARGLGPTCATRF